MKRVFSLFLLCTMCVLSLFACSEPDDGHGKPTVLGGESSDMISSLTEYLESLHQYVTPGETSLAIKIRRIREKGAQPLLVEFNSPECYYVCGYYKGTHSFKREKSGIVASPISYGFVTKRKKIFAKVIRNAHALWHFDLTRPRPSQTSARKVTRFPPSSILRRWSLFSKRGTISRNFKDSIRFCISEFRKKR